MPRNAHRHAGSSSLTNARGLPWHCMAADRLPAAPSPPSRQVFAAYEGAQDEAVQRRRGAVLQNSLLWRIWTEHEVRGRGQPGERQTRQKPAGGRPQSVSVVAAGRHAWSLSSGSGGRAPKLPWPAGVGRHLPEATDGPAHGAHCGRCGGDNTPAAGALLLPAPSCAPVPPPCLLCPAGGTLCSQADCCALRLAVCSGQRG